jgi:hypothetical protein
MEHRFGDLGRCQNSFVPTFLPIANTGFAEIINKLSRKHWNEGLNRHNVLVQISTRNWKLRMGAIEAKKYVA